MDDFDLEIKREFINEALLNLEESENSFMELETASDKAPLLDKIFRLAHNLKGGSRAVGFGDVAEFTHQLENLVLKIQKNEVVLSSDMITTLLRSNDRLAEMLLELKSNMNATFDNAELLQDIQNWLEGKSKTETAVAIAVESPSELQAPVENAEPVEKTADLPPSASAFFAEEELKAEPVQVAPVEPVAKAQASKSTAETKNNEKEDEVIRVSLSRIDMLNDYVGELIVLQSVIQQQVTSAASSLHPSLRQMAKLSKDIQHLSMSLRMLPVKPLVQKLQRVVRDTAKALNKNVSLQVEGEHLDIDKSVLDRLSDPLIHILRNAVDHGLETTQGRLDAGKNPEGCVTLSFSNEGNHLIVEVSDDGKGIHAENLKKKALEKKIITESQNLSEKQLIHLIFHPGFSTKTETSEISGRGVGMDVVKTNVEKVGGQVDVVTNVGKGSTFRIQIPLSLAVIEGLVVTSNSNRYVIPLNQVLETINLKTQKLFSSKLGIGSCFELRGNIVPLFNIEQALGLKSDSQIDPSHTGLVVNVGEQLLALVVKDVLRAQQIVIKPLGNGIMAQKGWVGSCVLGDGLPTLIISPADLLAGHFIQKLSNQSVGGTA